MPSNLYISFKQLLESYVQLANSHDIQSDWLLLTL